MGGWPGRASSVSAGQVPDELPPASEPRPKERDPPVPLPLDEPPLDSAPPAGDAPDAPVPVVAPDGVDAVPVDDAPALPPTPPPGVVPEPYDVPVVVEDGGFGAETAVPLVKRFLTNVNG